MAVIAFVAATSAGVRSAENVITGLVDHRYSMGEFPGFANGR